MNQKYLNEITHTIIGAAIEVHKELGPGLLESIYEKCMTHLLLGKGLHLVSQQRVPLYFRGLYLDCELRFDLLLENLIVVEKPNLLQYTILNTAVHSFSFELSK